VKTPAPEALELVLRALNQLGCPYIVTGSVASNAYGEPRGTIDADFVVQMQPGDVERLRASLSPEFDAEPQLAFETVTGKTQHKFRHRDSKFLIEIFEAEFNDPHERSRFERRRKQTILGHNTFFPTAEDVVIGKLRWYRQIRRAKDRDDLLKVIRHQMQKLDWPYIEKWCREHGTLELLGDVRREAAEDQASRSA